MYRICLSILLSNVFIQGMHQDASKEEKKAVGCIQQSLFDDYINVVSGYDLRPKKNTEQWAEVLLAIKPLSFPAFRVLTFMADQKKALIQQEQDQAVQALLSLRSMPVDKPILPSKSFSAGSKQSRKKKTQDVIVIDKHTAI